MEFVYPILIFVVMGIVFGVLLVVISKVFAVETDERAVKIEEIHGKAPIKKYFHGVLAKRGAFCYDRRYSCFIKNYTIFERGRQVL